MPIHEGLSTYVIVLGADASPSERRGADELQKHLGQIYQVEVPIVTDPEPLPERAILVGRSRATDRLGVEIDFAGVGEEGFRLKTVGERLVIAGGRRRGTLYGCTAFLEALGVRWFTPKVTLLPRETPLILPVFEETQAPAFEYREVFFTEAQERDWAARLRLNGAHIDLDEDSGGKITYHPFVHTLEELVPRTLYPTHPEYFPLVGGKRMDGDLVQRCLTHPEVLRLSIEGVRAWIREHPEATILSVSQNDSYPHEPNYCECENCAEVAGQYGGAQSGLILWFVNQVAQVVEQEAPDKLIDTLAYQYSEKPPVGIVPRPNVRIRLCLSCCVSHSLEGCGSEASAKFLANLRAWGAITDTLYIWHYTTDFAHYLLPIPNFEAFPADTRLYLKSGVKGIFFQGAYAPGGGGSDSELRSYVMSRLLWDPDQDANTLVTEWMRGVYGNAFLPMRKWFDLLHERVRPTDQHVSVVCPPDAPFLSEEVLEQGNRLFDEALHLAEGEDIATEYIDKARLTLRYVEIMRRPALDDAFHAFLADVRRLGITALSEGHSLEDWEAAYRKRVEEGR